MRISNVRLENIKSTVRNSLWEYLWSHYRMTTVFAGIVFIGILNHDTTQQNMSKIVLECHSYLLTFVITHSVNQLILCFCIYPRASNTSFEFYEFLKENRTSLSVGWNYEKYIWFFIPCNISQNISTYF